MRTCSPFLELLQSQVSLAHGAVQLFLDDKQLNLKEASLEYNVGLAAGLERSKLPEIVLCSVNVATMEGKRMSSIILYVATYCRIRLRHCTKAAIAFTFWSSLSTALTSEAILSSIKMAPEKSPACTIVRASRQVERTLSFRGQ